MFQPGAADGGCCGNVVAANQFKSHAGAGLLSLLVSSHLLQDAACTWSNGVKPKHENPRLPAGFWNIGDNPVTGDVLPIAAN